MSKKREEKAAGVIRDENGKEISRAAVNAQLVRNAFALSCPTFTRKSIDSTLTASFVNAGGTI